MESNIYSLIRSLTLYEDNYLQVQGVRVIVQGLEYHYHNSCDPGKKASKYSIHEITAYLNRLGQIYYFLKSDFMDTDISLIPNIESLIKFRMKYSAHRAVDAPRSNDFLMDLSSFSILSPYSDPWECDSNGMPDITKAKFGLQLAIKGISGDRETYNFFIEDEHHEIMREIEVSLRNKLSQLTA